MDANLASPSRSDFTMLPTPPNQVSSSSLSGPFRATEIWHDLVSALRSQVASCKRRRVKMKTLERCFSGHAATDTLLQLLLSDRYTFTNKKINRDNAVKLCQLMLDSDIIESVPTHRSGSPKLHIFEDSAVRFYRFCNEADGTKENTSRADQSTCNSCHNLSTDTSKDEEMSVEKDMLVKSKGSVSHHMSMLMPVWRRHSSSGIKSTPTQPSPETRRSLSQPALNSAAPSLVECEVRREVALSQLLALIDIPVLDSILAYNPFSSHSSSSGTSYSNLAFRRYESICSIFSQNSSGDEDMWWESGLDCLERLPNRLDILDNSLTEDSMATSKLRLFQALTDHYNKRTHPLWPDNFADVQVAVLRLLMEQRPDMAVHILQLNILLLSEALQDELRRLLDFMAHAAADSAIRLSPQVCNREQVERSFAGCVVRNPLLAPHQAGQLTLFLMDHVDQVWTEVDEVEGVVRHRLARINADLPTPALSVAFCRQVSREEFAKQQTECTERALVELINSVLDDTHTPLKDKKLRLKQMSKHHPAIFNTHFAHLKW